MVGSHVVVKHSRRYKVVGLSQQTGLMVAQADQVSSCGGPEAVECKDVMLPTDKAAFRRSREMWQRLEQLIVQEFDDAERRSRASWRFRRNTVGGVQSGDRLPQAELEARPK